MEFRTSLQKKVMIRFFGSCRPVIRIENRIGCVFISLFSGLKTDSAEKVPGNFSFIRYQDGIIPGYVKGDS